MLWLLLFSAASLAVYRAEVVNNKCTANQTVKPHFKAEIIQVPNHYCRCTRAEQGALRYRNSVLQICNGVEFVGVCGGGKKKDRGLGSDDFPARSCREILDSDSSAKSGLYSIKGEGDETIQTYCYMETICGTQGWTLIMKMDGYKPTFSYESSYWTNKHTYNPNGAAGGLDTTETKLETYNTFGFSKLCLGMRTGQHSVRWGQLNYKGSSLYGLIADNKYRPTYMGRSFWKSLVPSSSLQKNCNMEGFNAHIENSRRATRARIGIISNQENECRSPDSRIGFGTQGSHCGQKNDNSVGNEARCQGDNGDKSIRSFGYIFAQEQLSPRSVPLGSYDHPATSCKAIESGRTGAKSGAYYLDLQGHTAHAHCHMETICLEKGWTLLMKIDGSKSTFTYDSRYWTNEAVYNLGAASENLNTNTEMKLLAYSKLPLTKLCIGMRRGQDTRWLRIALPAKVSSLHSIIASNKFVATNLGRNAWKGLLSGSSLQKNCNREGFNNDIKRRGHARARIGIIANNENDCVTPDSRIGLGTSGWGCGMKNGHSAGNEARCRGDNGNKSLVAIGYIFAI